MNNLEWMETELAHYAELMKRDNSTHSRALKDMYHYLECLEHLRVLRIRKDEEEEKKLTIQISQN